jgi:hypothetical protein
MLMNNFDNIQCDGDLIFYRRGGQSSRKPPLFVWDFRRGYFAARAQLSDVDCASL